MNSKEINTKVLLEFLREYNHKQDYAIKTCRRHDALLDHRMEMLKTILKVKKAFECGKISIDVFSPGIMDIDWCIELLWYLGVNNLIDVAHYFIMKNHKKIYVVGLAHDLVSYYFCKEKSSFVGGIRGFMATKLSSLCQDDSTTDNPNLILTLFISSFTSRLELDDISNDCPLPILDEEGIDSEVRNRLGAAIVTQCFKNEGKTSKNALGSIDYYKPAHGTTCARFLEKVASSIPEKTFSTQILEFLMNCNDSSKVCWNNLALCIHSVLKINPSFHKPIILGLVEDSLKRFTNWQLYAALLIGRICTLKESPLNVTYLQWFSSTFSSDSHRPLNTDEKAKFFLRAMSDVLCVDPVSFTKVHIHKVASVPSTCQADLSEYLQMARTLLMSLNESIELGFFESTEEPNAAEHDVTCLLNHYRINKKLPQHFLSSINFRRHYFEKEFLPKFMSSCPGVNSDQHSILKQLAGMGKISASVMSKHTELCSLKRRKQDVKPGFQETDQ